MLIPLLWCAAVCILLLVLTKCCGDFGDADFKQKWPAISDEEFVKRCPPGTSKETALKVRRIVSKQLGYPYEHIHPGQNFMDDLG